MLDHSSIQDENLQDNSKSTHKKSEIESHDGIETFQIEKDKSSSIKTRSMNFALSLERIVLWVGALGGILSLLSNSMNLYEKYVVENRRQIEKADEDFHQIAVDMQKIDRQIEIYNSQDPNNSALFDALYLEKETLASRAAQSLLKINPLQAVSLSAFDLITIATQLGMSEDFDMAIDVLKKAQNAKDGLRERVIIERLLAYNLMRRKKKGDINAAKNHIENAAKNLQLLAVKNRRLEQVLILGVRIIYEANKNNCSQALFNKSDLRKLS